MKIIKPEVRPISDINGEDILLTIQRIAKTCYKSYKDSDNIESAQRIVRQLIKSGHTSMLEFATITMNYISNVAAYKDLTRQRLATFAVESTRYANYNKEKFGNELKFLEPVEFQKDSPEYEIWKQTMQVIEDNYMKLSKMGAKPDKKSLLLPHSLAAEFNIGANLREWRHILSLRSSVAATGHARPCIAQIMDPTLELFHAKIPVIFDDLYEIYKQNKQQSR